MTLNLRHPGKRRLARFVEGDLPRIGRALISRHLSRCERCRAEVEALRDLGRLVREAPVPPPSDTLLEKIKESVAAGRLVEPTLDPPIPIGPIRIPDSRRQAALSLTGLVILAAATWFALVPRLAAHHSILEFSPAAPVAAESIHMTYTAGALLTGEERVVARGRLYDRNAEWQSQRIVLQYDPLEHRYEAELLLPDSVVYAVFAVEDTTGVRVDTNQDLLWDLAVHDTVGRPRLEALLGRARRHYTGRLDVALETARAMTEHHPDRPESWSTLFAVEEMLTGPEDADELRSQHRPRFEALKHRFDAVSPSPQDLAWMAVYARNIGDTTAFARWSDRLLRDAPGTRVAIQLRLGELRQRFGSDPERLLHEHALLWDEVGPNEEIAANAFALAHWIGDGASAVLWAERQIRSDPAASPSVAVRLSELPDVREEGMGRLRTQIRRSDAPPDPAARPLTTSVPEHRAELEGRTSRLLGALGRALLAVDRPQAAIDTLALAAERAWDPEILRALAAAHLSHGDTTSALRPLAGLVVDPATGAEEKSELSDVARRSLSSAEWESELRQAEFRLREQVLSRAARRTLPNRMAIRDEQGRRRELPFVLEGQVTLVSLWHCFCAQFQPHVDRYADLARRLSAMDARVITIVTGFEDRSTQRSQTLKAAGLPVWTDPHGEVLRGFGYARTPAYFLVDAEGMVRFAYSPPDEVLRLAFVLTQETRNPPVAR